MSGEDWRAAYDRRDWAEVDNWWRGLALDGDMPLTSAERVELEELRRRLLADVPKVEVVNGMEKTERHVTLVEATVEWKGAAEILEKGELEAVLDGEPPTALDAWQAERARIAAILDDLRGAAETTKGDAALSRAAHIADVDEAFGQIDRGVKFALDEIDRRGRKKQERAWLREILAEVLLPAFRAGVHARAAVGKAIEADAVRGAKTIRAASLGGTMKKGAQAAQLKALIDCMKGAQMRNKSVAAAALYAFQQGHGASKAANERAWYRNSPE